jgi:hypothetical protein
MDHCLHTEEYIKFCSVMDNRGSNLQFTHYNSNALLLRTSVQAQINISIMIKIFLSDLTGPELWAYGAILILSDQIEIG